MKINILDKNGYKTVTTLNDGKNKIIAPYGFNFEYLNGQENITSFDFKHYNTSNITDMSKMFYDCSGLTSLDMTNFDTSNVTDMYGMFSTLRKITTLDVSKFDTSNVTDMSYMFTNCNSLISLDLSNFDTSNVTYMAYMFNDCNSLNYITCKQSFKDWCITNQDTIKLPTTMRDGGGGTWDIVA